MIHLMANNNQQQVPYQTQPPVQIPNPYPNYNNQNNNNNRRNQSNGKRQKRDDDWDICWDYLSPKGCNRDSCRWRHGNPKIDQRQIAKRRKRYMEQNRRDRDNNKHRKRKRKGPHPWRNDSNNMMQGAPPPPPYFAPPPPSIPQMPPPQHQPQQTQEQLQQQAQDYWAQYYAAYQYMQPPIAQPKDESNNKEENKEATTSYGYPGYGAYPYSYPYPYGAYGGYPQIPNIPKEKDNKSDKVDIDIDGNDLKDETEAIKSDDDDDEKPEKEKEEKEKETLDALGDPTNIADKEHNDNAQTQENEGDGKKDKDTNNEIQTKKNDGNENENKNESPNRPSRHPMFDGMQYTNDNDSLSDEDIDIEYAYPLQMSVPYCGNIASNNVNKKKKKLKGIDSSVKWLYIISDAKRECYGSLCRGQFDSITSTKWLTSLYESAEWGNGVLDRSRGQKDGPTPNHIAWYTLSGCNCSLNGIQDDENSNIGFPVWLQQITDCVMNMCSCDKNPPNCAELFYFENTSSRWNWHSYCEHEMFGNNEKYDSKHKGQTIHLLIGYRRQFKFAPRRTKAIPGDEERSVYLENGDVFVTCGKFTQDYVVKIECEDSNSRAHSSMYIVWRWIINHNNQCLHK